MGISMLITIPYEINRFKKVCPGLLARGPGAVFEVEERSEQPSRELADARTRHPQLGTHSIEISGTVMP